VDKETGAFWQSVAGTDENLEEKNK